MNKSELIVALSQGGDLTKREGVDVATLKSKVEREGRTVIISFTG